jgi:hypothetical protein
MENKESNSKTAFLYDTSDRRPYFHEGYGILIPPYLKDPPQQ